MVINVSVQYSINDVLLPDIILLLTLCDYIGRNHFNTINEGFFFCPYSQRSHLNLLTCLEGLDAFSYFSLNTECPERHIGAQHLPKLATILFSFMCICVLDNLQNDRL